MNLVVTGSLGNISQPLTRLLVGAGHTVTVVSSQAARQPAIAALGARAAIGSVADAAFLAATFAGADAVYCMLPPFDLTDPQLDAVAAATTLAENYAAAIRQAGVGRVVHLSSVGAHLSQGTGILRFHHAAEAVLRQLPAEVSLTHLRPVSFHPNLYAYLDLIKGRGLLGAFLTLRYAGLRALLRGERGVIVANYGGADVVPWVSPHDIAAAAAEELTTPRPGRHVRYVAGEELSCNEVAAILGAAIGKPYLKWGLMSDKQMLSALKSFGMAPQSAAGLVEMNAAIHRGLVDEDYYRHRPPVMGRVKLTEFAREFAAAYHQR